MEQVSIKLSKEHLKALHEIARHDDVTPGQIVRSLLNKEFRRRETAKTPERADELLVAPLRALLATDMSRANSWESLQENMREKGYELRESGGGLAVFRCADGIKLCKASAIGFAYSKLMRQIGSPFPDHSHAWLAHKMLDAHDIEGIDVIET